MSICDYFVWTARIRTTLINFVIFVLTYFFVCSLFLSVARLDDSNDQVRVAICSALVMFFQCGAHPKCFSSTTIDYTLDQLFIHLDDPEPSIQHAVLGAIVQVAKTLDKSAVLKKAEKNRDCHRTPVMCDRVMFEVTGVEILSE